MRSLVQAAKLGVEEGGQRHLLVLAGDRGGDTLEVPGRELAGEVAGPEALEEIDVAGDGLPHSAIGLADAGRQQLLLELLVLRGGALELGEAVPGLVRAWRREGPGPGDMVAGGLERCSLGVGELFFSFSFF